MFQLTDIKTIQLDRYAVNEVERCIKEKGLTKAIESYIKDMVACPPKMLYGYPVNHTKHFGYLIDVASLNYIFDSRLPTKEISQDDVNDYIEVILDLHNRNLEYEKDNPPRLPEPKKKGSKMPKSREPKTPKLPKQTEEVKIKEFPKITITPDFILNKLKKK